MGAAALPRIRSLGDLSSQGHSAPLSSKHLRRFRLSGLGLWLGAWGLGLGLVLHSWVGLRLGSNPSNLKPSSISQAQIRGNASSTGSENKGRPIAAVSWVASRPEPGTTKMCDSVSARPLLHNYDALRLSCELTNSRTCLKIPPPSASAYTQRQPWHFVMWNCCCSAAYITRGLPSIVWFIWRRQSSKMRERCMI